VFRILELLAAVSSSLALSAPVQILCPNRWPHLLTANAILNIGSDACSELLPGYLFSAHLPRPSAGARPLLPCPCANTHYSVLAPALVLGLYQSLPHSPAVPSLRADPCSELVQRAVLDTSASTRCQLPSARSLPLCRHLLPGSRSQAPAPTRSHGPPSGSRILPAGLAMPSLTSSGLLPLFDIPSAPAHPLLLYFLPARSQYHRSPRATVIGCSHHQTVRSAYRGPKVVTPQAMQVTLPAVLIGGPECRKMLLSLYEPVTYALEQRRPGHHNRDPLSLSQSLSVRGPMPPPTTSLRYQSVNVMSRGISTSSSLSAGSLR